MTANFDPSAGPTTDAPGQSGTTPTTVREQLRRLLDEGGTYRAIATAAGLAPTTIHDLASGRREPTPSTTRALRKVTSATVPRARLDAGGARLRLRALHVMGHSSARIARALGVRELNIRRIVRGDTTTINAKLRDAITDLYEAWWDKRAPERTRAERGAALAARRRAIAGNWCAGAGLDDDELDTPGYRPASRWKPATGTGTAPDIHPPARPHQAKKDKRDRASTCADCADQSCTTCQRRLQTRVTG
jgi:plasmid maintenance system antidote protein VapI